MKKILQVLGIAVFVTVIGLFAVGCGGGDDGPGVNPTKFAGKDVLGNQYSLATGSSARAATGERYSLDVTTRDGKTRTSSGIIQGVNADGTLTLKPDNGDAFTARTGGNSLRSVAADGNELAKISFDDDSSITPRSFNQIQLRATRWVNDGGDSGEHWGSWESVLVSDFPTNVSKLDQSNGRYTVTVTGRPDKTLSYVRVEIQGLKKAGGWDYMGGSHYNETFLANVTTTKTINLSINNNYNLLDYEEIIMQITNLMKFDSTSNPVDNVNHGGIPANVEDGQLMATISNFNISLVDTDMDNLKGNLGNFSFGYAGDGLSIDYKQAVWKLTPQQIVLAKQGANFEFNVYDPSSSWNDGLPHAKLRFIWQDPVRGLWWVDDTLITDWDDTAGWHIVDEDKFAWDAESKRYIVNLSKVIDSTQFRGVSSQANFIILLEAYSDHDDKDINTYIDHLSLTGANIVIAPRPTAGNMGNYNWGYTKDLEADYKQAAWSLPADILAMAKEESAKLVIEFANNNLTTISPHLILVWQSYSLDNSTYTPRWWPADDSENYYDNHLTICHYDNTEGRYVYKEGVSYDAPTKKLTIILQTALEDYTNFKAATGANANFVLGAGWLPPGITDLNGLNIVSVNIEVD